MAHEVENMAYSGETPWHGLGVRVEGNLSAEDMMKAAGLDWNVSKEALFLANGRQIDKHHALVRDSDGACLDVVGPEYKPVQNVEAFSFFKEFVEAGQATMETAGSLRKGKMVWGLANLGHSFKLRDKDEVKGYLLVASPHQQGKAMVIQLTTVRVVCNNTITMALRSGGDKFRMIHRHEFNDEMMANAKEVLGIANEQLDTFEKNARKLQNEKMSREEQLAFLASLCDADAPAEELVRDPTANGNKLFRACAQALTHSPGAMLESSKNTAWGTLNAVTFVADHVIGGNQDRRLDRAWFGATANLKSKAMAGLINLS